MTISRSLWMQYVSKLRKIDDRAAEEMLNVIHTYGLENSTALVKIAYQIASKYGEASGALACMMYDKLAELSRVKVSAAKMADTATYSEVAKAVNGTLKTGNEKIVSSAVGNLVKRVSVDTMMKNALRDGAEWAWIPNGDTCAFCLTLASQGWQRASKNALKNGHAEHIHANCDCSYCVRFDSNTTVDGYDPDALYEQYKNADPSHSPKDKINAMRREHYQEHKDEINAQKRAAYAARKEREREG